MLRLLALFLLAGPAWAGEAPFRTGSGAAALPDIGNGITQNDGEKALATMTEQSLSAGQYGWRSTLLDRTGNGLESLLDQYGEARVDARIDDSGRLGGANADLLLPLGATGSRSRFAQFGVHNDNARTVSNAGVVQREHFGTWLGGYSAFVDQEIGGNTTRVGLGASGSTDYLRIAVNTYVPAGHWQDDGERSERAAAGFDLNAQAHLPSYPQLGGSVKYERYRGDDITLPGSGTGRDNPSAVSASLQYTPVPLLRFGASYRRDDNDESDWQVQATMSYRLGVPLARQLRGSDPQPSLFRRRDDFVDRNGSVATESRTADAPAFSASLSADSVAQEQTAVATLSIQCRHPVVSLSWLGDAAPLLVGGGTSTLLGRTGTLSARIRIALPADGRDYTLAARIVDSNGNTTVTPAIRLQRAPAA
ncbi:inverse autotransporter beta domain-containing protein [Jeongeupia chitinilytica]|uniref:Inverse autotransporter beta-domain domain-containing protein n=1 Tax=Jeongeupia chitinilytica TaxID=1041641 RepID=A0ABQ3GX31_9NEIS|nr:inverse autotransporter beta domain-containing protein [Jeongeupia chitinilytica]GHD55502.1 hypothetical protein GCM10007350_01260 [Jeongeupia chitinilytica]